MVQLLVPFSEMTEDELNLVANKPMQLELEARGKSKQGKKAELAHRLFMLLAPAEAVAAATRVAADRAAADGAAAGAAGGAAGGAMVADAAAAGAASGAMAADTGGSAAGAAGS